MDRQCVDPCGELFGKRPVNHAVTFEPGLSTEYFGHDMNSKMRLAAWTVPGMTFMPVRFIDYVKALRRKRRGKFFGNGGLHRHRGLPKGTLCRGQPAPT
jgi:hypothetical protein